MVNFAIRNDSSRKLRFATLQSPIGLQLRKKYNVPASVDSVVFIEEGKAHIYAHAALRICKYLDWPARALYGLIIIPSFICNPIYKWIAKNRYKWFGKKESCMIPTAEVKTLFMEDAADENR